MLTPPTSSSRTLTLAGALVIVVAVAAIYRTAIGGYFFNDDFQWLQEQWTFDFWSLFDLGRYTHFYRPMIEIYFYLAGAAFGCHPVPFHVVSVAIHLVNTWLLYAIARDLTQQRLLAAIAALLFAVQPAYVEAVAWVAAIGDLLPATWTLLTLWLHLRFVRDRRALDYALSLVVFAVCLLTHESSAVLLAMMVALEFALVKMGRDGRTREGLAGRAIRYAPFVLLLAGSLTIAFVVNRRSYVVQEGHYMLGWHVVWNVLNDVVGLFVGKHHGWSYVAIVTAFALAFWRGGWPVRFAIVWLLIAAAPSSLFTWGVASRYLYVPAAAFSLLLAAGVSSVRELAAGRWSPPWADRLAAAVTIVLAARFGFFAADGSRDLRDRARPYERLAATVQNARRSSAASEIVLTATDVENIPDIYREAAARVAACSPDVTVTLR